jgi:pimeloyl-ACP methyl ester carboxylesterase
MRRLSAIGRLIHFDRRGTGISDPVSIEALPDLETQVEDVIAVLDAAGSQQASVLGMGEGGLLAILVAALYPRALQPTGPSDRSSSTRSTTADAAKSG